jgi:putative transposase
MSKEYNVNILCEALKVAKGTFYNHILRNKRENTVYAKRKAELKQIIEEIFHKSRETYGSTKLPPS